MNSPTPQRVIAIVEHMDSLGAYTQGTEVLALCREREFLRTRTQWQPIETAPKDGTRFLAISPNIDGPFIASWWRSWYGIEGFGVPGPYGSFSDGISHWMPIPESPK